jgi:hypothetical protein
MLKRWMPCAGIPHSVRKSSAAALQNPAFVAELTRLINQGYWYFEE